MEDRIIVEFDALDRIARQLKTAGAQLDSAANLLSGANLTRDSGAYMRVSGHCSLKTVGGTVSASNVAQAVSSYRAAISRVGAYSSRLGAQVGSAAAMFREAEGKSQGEAKSGNTGEKAPTSQGEGSGNKSFFGNLFTWSNLWKVIAEAGLVGGFASMLGELWTGGTTAWPKRIMQLLKGGAKFGGNLTKALSEPSFDWKRLFGWQAAITGDTPTSFAGAMGEELSKYSFGNATTVSEKIAVGCKWAGSILTVGISAYDNYQEGKESGYGAGRIIGETVIESAVKIGGGMLISAGVTAAAAALGFVGAPAIVIGGISVGVSIGLNALCKTFTGKDIAENVSDFVFDTLPNVGRRAGEIAGNALDTAGRAVSNAANAVERYVSDAASRLGDGARRAGSAITGWWRRATGSSRGPSLVRGLL